MPEGPSVQRDRAVTLADCAAEHGGPPVDPTCTKPNERASLSPAGRGCAPDRDARLATHIIERKAAFPATLSVRRAESNTTMTASPCQEQSPTRRSSMSPRSTPVTTRLTADNDAVQDGGCRFLHACRLDEHPSMGLCRTAASSRRMSYGRRARGRVGAARVVDLPQHSVCCNNDVENSRRFSAHAAALHNEREEQVVC